MTAPAPVLLDRPAVDNVVHLVCACYIDANELPVLAYCGYDCSDLAETDVPADCPMCADVAMSSTPCPRCGDPRWCAS